MACLEFDNVCLRYSSVGDAAKSMRAKLASLIFNGSKIDTRPVYVNALNELNFCLRDGDRLGLIGANGAGKSTLLRTMAGIYQPTAGSITRQGKILTMFDLSCGMDEEADALENIEIAAATLGIRKKDLQRVQTDVIEFSELGDAVFRPIRTYSAGMRVRLAFGLVSSLCADILLIDEIIGVGDAHFMKKASERIKQKINAAKIFVLASHADSVLHEFCTIGVVLSQGRIQFQGSIDEAIRFYHAKGA